MSVSVYLSNRNIQIVLGTSQGKSIKAQSLYSLDLSEDCLLNGTITNEAQLKTDLESIWNKYQLPRKNVSLVIDSNQFVLKQLNLPRLGDKKLLDIIQRELSDMAAKEAPIYDYVVLDKDKKGKTCTVMAGAVEKSFLENYREVFKSIGITLNGIRASRICELKLLALIPELKQQTCIIQLLDGDNIFNMLLVDGDYTYSTRSRIFSSHDTEQFGVDVAQNISGLLQFHASEKNQSPITHVYLGGFGKADYDYSSRNIQSLNLSVSLLPDSPEVTLPSGDLAVVNREMVSPVTALADYVSVMGNFIDPKEMNLLDRIKADPQKAAARKKIIMPLIPVAALLLIFAGVFGYIKWGNHQIQTDIDEAEAYLNDENHISDYALSMGYQELANRTSLLISQTNKDLSCIQSYPWANTQVRDYINQRAGTRVSVVYNSYTSADGQLSISATAANVNDINAFIAGLEQGDVFARVSYTGYQYDQSANVFNINVACVLSQAAGK